MGPRERESLRQFWNPALSCERLSFQRSCVLKEYAAAAFPRDVFRSD